MTVPSMHCWYAAEAWHKTVRVLDFQGVSELCVRITEHLGVLAGRQEAANHLRMLGPQNREVL